MVGMHTMITIQVVVDTQETLHTVITTTECLTQCSIVHIMGQIQVHLA